MTAAELDQIESELDLALPLSYREFMQSGKFGEGYEGTQCLYGMADEVIKETKSVRKNGFYGVKWPENYLVIGDDGAGNVYFTDVTQERPAVLMAQHELTIGRRRLEIDERDKHQTFVEFWQNLQKWYEETDIAIEKQNKKRWWRFWII